MAIKIRKFEEHDLKEVLELCNEVREHHREILHGYFTPQDNELEQQGFLSSLTSDKDIALVAVEDNEIKGLLLAEKRFSPFLEQPRIGYIHNFGVFKKHRHQGIGQLLMQAFLEECKACNISEIKLGVFNANQSAYAFYEDFGFTPQEQKMSLHLK